MAGRFKRQPASVLEIRGISRGSVMDHPRIEPVNEPLMIPAISKGLYYYDAVRPALEMDSDDDDDESTIVGGSGGMRSSSPHSPSHSEDTITASDTSHYWSAGNSFTTGNTTERSSVYSWGDDEFDHQASKLVRQMFQAIEQMLFEGVLSGSTSLQHECREWMSAFPHLRILGKQILSPRDDGFQSLPSTSKRTSLSSNDTDVADDDILTVKGLSLTPQPVPSHLVPSEQESGRSPQQTPAGGDLSYLHEEIYEEDGTVEEYLAYDIREMDEEEHAKRYYVPRRRRLGFPPITPNACVRDAVLHHVFDAVWSRVVACLSGADNRRSKTSLLKLLVQNISWSHDTKQPSHHQGTSARNNDAGENIGSIKYANDPRAQQLTQSYYPFDHYDDDEVMYDPMRQIPGIVVDRIGGQTLLPGSSFMIPPSIPQRLLYPDSMGLPPSRGSIHDQSSIGGRHLPFASGRLSTAPHQNIADLNSLNDLMKISRKKLQARSERLPISNEDLSPGVLHDPRFPGRPSSSHYINGANPVPGSSSLGTMSHHLSAIGISGSTSPLATPNRPFTSRDVLPRQQSATARKGRGGRLARLLPLDRAKTPNVDFDGLNVKATKLVPGYLEPSVSSLSGMRVNSPPHSFQPPPTAPNPTTGTLWLNSRLPPISSSLESLPENTLSDFKKTRGRTAYTRISSAIADDKPANRGFDNMSRPNTTHTFRADNLIPKRATSVTPSNFMFGAQGNSIGITGLKSTSPAGGFVSSGGTNMPFPQHSSSSPDNLAGLVGITGRSINLGMNTLVQSTSPDDEPGPPQSSWGPSSQNINASHVRRKRQVLGLI